MKTRPILILFFILLSIYPVLSTNITATLHTIEEGTPFPIPTYSSTYITTEQTNPFPIPIYSSTYRTTEQTNPFPIPTIGTIITSTEQDNPPTIQVELYRVFHEDLYFYGNIIFRVLDNEQRVADCYLYLILQTTSYLYYLGEYNTNTRYNVSFNTTLPEFPIQEAYLLCIVGPGTDTEQLLLVPLFQMYKLTYKVLSVLQYVVITLPYDITTDKIYSISMLTVDNREVPITTKDIIYKNERTLIIRLPTLANYIYIYTIA